MPCPLPSRYHSHCPQKLTVQATWVPHGVDRWHIAPAPLHYRCYKVYITSTHAERIADMVKFFPTTAKMPQILSADAAARAVLDLIEV
eukprot:10450393-Ditylum_brightwellii.AAC.1